MNIIKRICSRRRVKIDMVGRVLRERNLTFDYVHRFVDGSSVEVSAVATVTRIKDNCVTVHIEDVLGGTTRNSIYWLYLFFTNSKETLHEEVKKELYRIVGQYIPKQAIIVKLTWEGETVARPPNQVIV